jgi:hypothetical protein
MIHLRAEITAEDVACHRTCHTTECLIGKALNRALAALDPPLSGHVLAETFVIDLGRAFVEVPMDRRMRRMVERCDCGDPIKPQSFELLIPDSRPQPPTPRNLRWPARSPKSPTRSTG